MTSSVPLEIFLPNLYRVGFVTQYQSLIWARRYFTPGDFSITAPANPHNISMLKKHVLIKPKHTKEIGIINSLEIKRNQDGTEMIQADGLFLTGHLGKRAVIQEDGTLAGLIRLNCVSPADSRRRFDKLELGKVESLSYPNNNFQGESLTTVLEALARAHNFGWRIVMEDHPRRLLFETYRGLDRTEAQKDNPRARFSKRFGNLGESVYTESDVGAFNTIYGIANVPESATSGRILTYQINPGLSGVERYEKMIQMEAATISQSHTDSEGNTTTTVRVDEAQTLENLKSECEKALQPETSNFEGQVSQTSGYREKWDLGDVVTIKNEDWQLSIDQRIYEITEVYDNRDNKITPTFGTPQKTILDLLKEKK